MLFKGIEIEMGDIIAFTHTKLPHEIQATIIDIKNSELEILSTLLVPYHEFLDEPGILLEDEVVELIKVESAIDAIPKESRGCNFQLNQRVTVTVQGVLHHASVKAAFDGLVYSMTDDGLKITGGSNFYELAT